MAAVYNRLCRYMSVQMFAKRCTNRVSVASERYRADQHAAGGGGGGERVLGDIWRLIVIFIA